MRAWLIGLVALSASCYRPKLGNPGFYCVANANPACPDGQLCVDGRCVDPGTMPELGTFDGPASDQALADLSSAQDASGPVDLGKEPDLAPMCVASGGSCYYHRNNVCCSGYCIYMTNKCR